MQFEILSLDDRFKHLELLRAGFNKPELSRRWHSWYNNCPSGAIIWFVARDGDRFAGTYGMLPYIVKTPHSKISAVLACNICVHPDYRGQGLFTSMSKHVLEECSFAGYSIALGMPNGQALPGHLKAGWEVITKLDKLVHTPLPRAPEPWAMAVANEFHNPLPQHAERFGLCIEKNAAWLNWRLQDRHGEQYVQAVRLDNSGYMVLKRYGERLHIVDTCAQEVHTLDALIEDAKVLAEKDSLTMDLWMPHGQDCIYSRAFMAAGFTAEETENDCVIFQQLNDLPSTLLQTMKNGPIWFCYADNDVH